MTPVFGVPVIVAKNCCVLGEPPDGDIKTYEGDRETEIEPLVTAMTETMAVALRAGSAWLTAVSETGLFAGTEAGAR